MKLSPTQQEWVQTIARHGSVRVEDIPLTTFRALKRRGLLEETPRMYFGPRAHCVRLSPKGRQAGGLK